MVSVLCVCVFQELSLHITASIKNSIDCSLLLFSPFKLNGKKMVLCVYVLCVYCKQCLLQFISTQHPTDSETLLGRMSSIKKLVKIVFQCIRLLTKTFLNSA